MKFINLTILFLMLLSFFDVKGQDYSIRFSKEDKKAVYVKEGRNISFVFAGSEEWSKARIEKISADSLFLEQPISKDDILSERESNFTITSYLLSDFRMMAFPTTGSVTGKGAVVVLLVATVVAVSWAGGGAGFVDPFVWDDEDSKAKKKFFKKNVDFDKGWKAEIVEFD